jgi:hypothetical protein
MPSKILHMEGGTVYPLEEFIKLYPDGLTDILWQIDEKWDKLQYGKHDHETSHITHVVLMTNCMHIWFMDVLNCPFYVGFEKKS